MAEDQGNGDDEVADPTVPVVVSVGAAHPHGGHLDKHLVMAIGGVGILDAECQRRGERWRASARDSGGRGGGGLGHGCGPFNEWCSRRRPAGRRRLIIFAASLARKTRRQRSPQAQRTSWVGICAFSASPSGLSQAPWRAGHHHCGTDGVGGDSAASPFQSQHFGQADQAELGCAVGECPGSAMVAAWEARLITVPLPWASMTRPACWLTRKAPPRG